MATPCCTTRYCSRIESSTSSGRPPSTMKFSEIISNQSTTGFFSNVPVVRDAQSDPDPVISVAVKRVGGHERWESPGLEPGLPTNFPVRLLGFAAVSGATAFAFAGVFAFATGVTSLAAALAFAGVFSLAGMGALLVRHRLKRDSSLSGCVGCVGANRKRPGHEPGHRGARDECFRCVHLVFWFLAF